MVEPARLSDIPSWLALAREVEPLFGPMLRFEVTLKAKIAEGAALCVHDLKSAVAGGLLLGGAAPDHWIRWLAVRRDARRGGAGSALLRAALERCPAPCTVSLATFGVDIAEGRPARRLYEHFGFEVKEMLPRGPEGGTRQKYLLVRM